MADRPQVFSPADTARLRKMLAAFESGHFSAAPSTSGATARTPETIWCKVESIIAVGKYGMTLLLPPTGDIPLTGPVTAADFGVAYTGPTNYIGINSIDVGQSAAALNVGDICRCSVHRVQGSTIIVKIERVGWELCPA